MTTDTPKKVLETIRAELLKFKKENPAGYLQFLKKLNEGIEDISIEMENIARSK